MKEDFKLKPGERVEPLREGEEKWSWKIGYQGRMKYVAMACKNCGNLRWVQKVYIKRQKTGLCSHCCLQSKRVTYHGHGHPCWKGGRNRVRGGWIQVYIERSDFFYSMADKNNYVLEHRLIMAKHLNRCLLPWEIVHHKNGVRDDNRLGNLKLFSIQAQHLPYGVTKKRLNCLEERVTQLEAENVLLRRGLEEIYEGIYEIIPPRTR